MVRKVAAEYGDDRLAALVGSQGVQGVEGDLKNLIFAAHGAKPRIVLRDAIGSTCCGALAGQSEAT